MRRISEKRRKRVESGDERLGHNSTFGASKRPDRRTMTIEELKASGAVSKASARGKSEKARAKARAWKQFSMFIRLRDSGPDGIGKCVTCDRRAHWRTMDAGHFLTRAKEATLFDERNVHLQCKGCNRFQGGKFFEHEQAVDRIHGPGTVEELKRKAAMPCRRVLNDYLFIEKTYKERVEWIKEHEPEKFQKM